MLSLMKRAGLKRLYLGIETSSQRLLDYYRKGYKKNSIKGQVKLIKENDIEVAGFFMVGGLQSEEELEKDIVLVKELNFDYIMVEKITPYPGTKLFEDMKEDITFNLFPYLNTFKNVQLQKKTIRFEKLFYRNFYLNPRYFIKMFKYLFLNPRDLINGTKRSIRYLFSSQANSQATRPELI